jgi:hypothetical protein
MRESEEHCARPSILHTSYKKGIPPPLSLSKRPSLKKKKLKKKGRPQVILSTSKCFKLTPYGSRVHQTSIVDQKNFFHA